MDAVRLLPPVGMILVLVGCEQVATADEVSDLDETLSSRLTELEARVADAESRASEAETRLAASEQAVSDLTSATAAADAALERLNGAMVFVGENDSSFSLDLGSSEDSGDETVDDSTIASSGSTLVGAGSMFGTSFDVPTLDTGVFAVSLSIQWGAGINEEAITQRFQLDCSGVEVLYQPRTTISAGDADENGINVAYPIVVRAWVRATTGDDLTCELTKRTLDIARTGSGILYNDLNGPVVATVELVVPE